MLITINTWFSEKKGLPAVFQADILEEREKALKVSIAEKIYWLPKSQIISQDGVEAVKEAYLKKGDRVELKKWIANTLADEKGMAFFFRNIKVEEVLRETSKAVEIKTSFVSDVATTCHCCGRDLDNDISRAVGVGAVCAKKYLGIKRPTMKNAKEILAKIDEEAKNAGVLKVWIPKSQIKKIN